MPVPLDELPIHQVPLSMRHMLTSDQNAYDRCYLNAHDRSGEVFFVTGLGVYPNLGVIDAFATITRKTRQSTLRLSDALAEDRSIQRVGPYRVEVVKPLETIRVVCEPNDAGLCFDLLWTGSFVPIEEPRHVMRQGGRVILDASRFAQVGTWSGSITLDDEVIEVGTGWVGTRDRSWGIRPVGEAQPPGRAGAEPEEGFGFWWTYVPIRFDDFCILVMAQEDGAGVRTLNEAVRVWGPDGRQRPTGAGRADPVGGRDLFEQLGWPEIDISYRPGTRIPMGATIEMGTRGNNVKVDVETLGYVALNGGPGYGGDPDWSHGAWRGRDFRQRVDVDLEAPDVAARTPFGVLDHVARATCDGQVGWGMFEHGTFGCHLPSGFTDWSSVAS